MNGFNFSYTILFCLDVFFLCVIVLLTTLCIFLILKHFRDGRSAQYLKHILLDCRFIWVISILGPNNLSQYCYLFLRLRVCLKNQRWLLRKQCIQLLWVSLKTSSFSYLRKFLEIFKRKGNLISSKILVFLEQYLGSHRMLWMFYALTSAYINSFFILYSVWFCNFLGDSRVGYNWWSLHKKMMFSLKDFFSKCDQIRNFLRIWSHLIKKSLKENFTFCAVDDGLFLWNSYHVIAKDSSHCKPPTLCDQDLSLSRTWIQICWMKLGSSDNRH